MKSKISVILALFIIALAFPTMAQKKDKKSKKSTKAKSENTMDFNSDVVKVSYSLGINIAENLKGQGLDSIDAKAFAQGLSDVFSKDSLKMSQEEANAFLQQYFSSIQQKQGEVAAEEGNNFLAENAKKEGVNVTASGLQYEVVTMGTGEKPKATDQVTVHYTGKLINGKVFDSSVQRGQPATFGLNQVIPGWTEGLQLMPVGSKFILYLPYNLAYGQRGAGNDIPPYAALVFEVELLDIAK
jgi:FKBP-type peptidyl-prolyl cis-trans isomerase FklB